MSGRNSAKRTLRAAKRQPKSRGSRAVSAAVGWREIALALACVEIAIFVLVLDPSVRDVFDLPKATFTHALAWVLLGVLVVVALVDGVRVPVSPLFLAFYAMLATELLTTATATNQYVAVFGEVGRYLGLTTHAVLALVAITIALATDYPRRAAWLAWTVGGIAVAASAYVFATPLGGRLFALADSPEVSGRILIYQAAARIFADHPVLGAGFENFAVVYPQYEEAEGLKNNRTQTSAHSWLFHTAATTGIVGLVSLAALLTAFAVHAWRRARDADAAALLTATAAIAAYYGSGLVLPGAQSIQWIPWACVGIALASDLRTARVIARTPTFRLAGLARLVIVVGLTGAAFLQLTSLNANRSAKVAETSLRAETAPRAVTAARLATTTDPGRAIYWNDLGRALELVDDQAAARSAYLEATARSPYTAAFWWNLGRMHLYFAERGDGTAKNAAYETMRRAIAAAPQNPDTFDQFARIQLALEDLAGALESSQKAIALYPGEPKYYTVAGDAARRQGDVAKSLQFLRQGVANTDSNDLRLTFARRLAEASQFAASRTVLQEVLIDDPHNAAAADLLKQIEGR